MKPAEACTDVEYEPELAHGDDCMQDLISEF